MSGSASPPTTVTVPDDLAGQRLDRVLASLLTDLSRSKIQRLISADRVVVDEAPATKASLRVEGGQQITVSLPDETPVDEPRPQFLDLDIVHRLDKGTSGLMAVARNDDAHAALAEQFAERTVEKEYNAVVYGCPREWSGEVDLAIGRDRADRTKISPNTDRPRQAFTRWELAEDLGGFALLRVWPKTGRTHQVRAHLAAIHHPCVGDLKYVGAQWKSVPDGRLRKAIRGFGRPALHARRLRLDHPLDGARLEFVAPLPADLEELLGTLRRARDESC